MLNHGDESQRAVAERARGDRWDRNSSVALRYITVSGLSDGNNLSVGGVNVAA